MADDDIVALETQVCKQCGSECYNECACAGGTCKNALPVANFTHVPTEGKKRVAPCLKGVCNNENCVKAAKVAATAAATSKRLEQKLSLIHI